MKSTTIYVCILFGVLASIHLPQTAAVCCAKKWPLKCCGARSSDLRTGPRGCNIFCCNCDGGRCIWDGMTQHQIFHQIVEATYDGLWGRNTCFRAAYHNDKNIDKLDKHIRHQKLQARWDRSAKKDSEAELLFSNVDINEDNFISIEEAEIFFEKQNQHNRTIKRRNANNFFVRQEIRKMDSNRDGLISPPEFDESLRN